MYACNNTITILHSRSDAHNFVCNPFLFLRLVPSSGVAVIVIDGSLPSSSVVRHISFQSHYFHVPAQHPSKLSKLRHVHCLDVEIHSLKGALYRIWCGVSRLGDSGVHTLGDRSAFVNPAGQLLLTRRG